jgi:hypothetical protein
MRAALPRSRSPRRCGAALGRAVAVLVALAGLFAMHGLSDHGVAHHAAGGTVEMSDGSGMAAIVPVDAHRSPHADDTERSPAPDDDGLVGLCLALLSAGLVLALALGRHGWRRGLHASYDAGRRAITAARSRPLDPPDLVRLSIQRC